MLLGVEGENIREVEVEKINKIWLKHYDDGVRAHIDYPIIPAYDILDKIAKEYPEKYCSFFYGNYLTFKQMKDSSEKVCGYLQSIGFEKGDKAIVSLPNTPHYVPIAYGIMKAGGIVVQCNPLYTTREIKYIAKTAEQKLFFA